VPNSNVISAHESAVTDGQRSGANRPSGHSVARRKHPSPGDGERRAMAGYVPQYDVAGVLILEALLNGLEWIRVADPRAGRVDDVQYGTAGRVDGYQVKWGRAPRPLTWHALLGSTSKGTGHLRDLADGWKRLRVANPEHHVVVHLVTNSLPSPQKAARGSLERFLREAWPMRFDRDIAPAAGWRQAWTDLRVATGLGSREFAEFARCCELEPGYALYRSPYADPHNQGHGLPLGAADIAALLPRLAAAPDQMVEIGRVELLRRLGWSQLFAVRNHHDFPVDRDTYRAPRSDRAAIDELLDTVGGYVAVLGPPGSGKSSLLTESLRSRDRVVRYYAFVPGDTAGALRGEAVSYLHDTVLRLQELDFDTRELVRDDEQWLQRKLRRQFAAMGRQHLETGERTILLVDGLDHALTEASTRPFFASLPEPSVIPDGVLVVLGSQTLALAGLAAEIREQVGNPGRSLNLGPLDAATVDEIIDAQSFDPVVTESERTRIHELAGGHPLTLVYLLRSLSGADSRERNERLKTTPTYQGDLRAYYAAHWSRFEREADVRDALILAARMRGTIDPHWLARNLDSIGLGYRLEDLVGHFFRKGTPNRWTFFHDSFRQYLVARTISDDALCHRRLADWHGRDPSSPDRLFHLLKAGDNEAVLALSSFEFFRGQLARLRPPSAIEADARLVAEVASRHRDLRALVQATFVAAEMEQRDGTIDRGYLLRILGRLGEVDGILAFAGAPAQAGSSERLGLEASLALWRAGAVDEALRIFDDESNALLRETRSAFRGQADLLGEWGRTAANIRGGALGDLVDSLRAHDGDDDRASPVAAAAGKELVALGDPEGALAFAGRLSSKGARLWDARAAITVDVLRYYRLAGRVAEHVELAGASIHAFRSRPLAESTLFEFIFEVAAAKARELPEIVSKLSGPRTIDGFPSDGFRRYRATMWWMALQLAVHETVDIESLKERLGKWVDARVVRVAQMLATMLATLVERPLNVESFGDLALRVSRAFLLRADRPRDDDALVAARGGAHADLFMIATWLGPQYLVALFAHYEDEWHRPHLAWPDDLRRAILLRFLGLGGWEARVRPHLVSLNAKSVRGDIQSRFVGHLEAAESWLLLGEADPARESVRTAMLGGFGVGFRKDDQLDHLMTWVQRFAERSPAEIPGLVTAIAGAMPELADQTDSGAADHTSATLINIAVQWRPSSGLALMRWLVQTGAITFHSGTVALLTSALRAGASAGAVAELATAFVLPVERGASHEFATLLCSALRVSSSKDGVGALIRGLRYQASHSVRPSWVAAMRETLLWPEQVSDAELDEILTSGYSIHSGDERDDRRTTARPEPAGTDALLDWLRAERFPSSSMLRAVVPKAIKDATDADLTRLAREEFVPAVALRLAADILVNRGNYPAAQRLAELALERRNPNGWDRWYDEGSVLETLGVLHRLNPARCRDLAWKALGSDIASGGASAPFIIRSIEETCGFLSAEDLLSEVWPAAKSYLDALLGLNTDRPTPDLGHPTNASVDEVLADLTMSCLSHPVAVLAQLAREATARLAAHGWQPMLDAVEARLEAGLESDRLYATCAIEAAALMSPNVLSTLGPLALEPLLSSPILDVRLSAARLLSRPFDDLPVPPRESVPTIYLLSLPPNPGGIAGGRRLPEMGRPVADSSDPFELLGAFESEIRMLASEAGVSVSAVALRALEISREVGLDAAFGQIAEMAVIDDLRKAAIEYAHFRPRSTAARLAVGYTAAELLDHGLIGIEAVTRMQDRFRWTDARLDILDPWRPPAWLDRPLRTWTDRIPLSDWVEQATVIPRSMPRTDFGWVVAETSKVRSLDWSRPTETRHRSVAWASEAAALVVGDGELFEVGDWLTSRMEVLGSPGGPLVYRSSPMRYQTMKPSWLCLNAAAARAVGWHHDHGQFGLWRTPSGEPRARSKIWMDGLTSAPVPDLDAHPAEGAYLEVTSEGLNELEILIGPLLVVESVRRTATDDRLPVQKEVRAYWDWRAHAAGSNAQDGVA
jgi:hypothetical protein